MRIADARPLLALIVLLAAAPEATAQHTEPGRITFTETIAPILYEHCVACHRPGEIGPFSLITYADTVRHGRRIAEVTASRAMPPWQPARGVKLIGERRLTGEEIEAIGRWVEQGMPEGDSSRMPALPPLAEGWRLGEPDLVLEMPDAFDLPAGGHDVYRNFVLPTGLAEDRWVRAVELRASAR